MLWNIYSVTDYWINNPARISSKIFLYVWYDRGIDWFKYAINMTIIKNRFCFWVRINSFELKLIYFVGSSLSIFLNSIANVVTNLNPLNSVSKFDSFFLIADSVSVNYSSRLKNSKYQHYKNLHNLYEHEIVSLFLHIFFLSKKCSRFVASLYKRLLKFLPVLTFLASLKVLHNLWELFGCSIVTDWFDVNLVVCFAVLWDNYYLKTHFHV